MAGLDPAEVLISSLANREGSGQLYRLVDPADMPGRALSDKALEECGLIRNPFFADPKKRQLYLQPVSGGSDELRRMVVDERVSLPRGRLEPVAFCGWIYTSQPLPRVVSHMEKQLSVRSPEGKVCLLRFHDPRVLERLEAILDSSQLSRLLWPIDTWFYFDHRKQLRELSPHGEKRGLGRLKLTERQWRSIKRIARVNKVLDSCGTLKEQPKGVSPADIDVMLEQAEAYGIEGGADMNLFAMHGLCYTPGFHRHQAVQAILRKVAKGESYRALSRQLKRNDWEVIIRDMEGERQ